MTWAVVEIHSGEAVDECAKTGCQGDPVIFDTEAAAQAWALRIFGLDAGKEYSIALVEPSITEQEDERWQHARAPSPRSRSAPVDAARP